MPSKFKPTRTRKHRTLARLAQSSDSSSTRNATTDSNSPLLTTSKSEKDARRTQLRDELRAQQPKISGAKQKRLDKYIETKLKKEENLELIKKLGEERARFDTSGLARSGQLGKKRKFGDFVGGQLTGEGLRSTVVVEEVVRPSGEEKTSSSRQRDTRTQKRGGRDDDVDSLDSFEEEHEDAFVNGNADDEEEEEQLLADDAWTKKRVMVAQGAGLAQPLQIDPDGMPIIPSRNDERVRNEDEDESASEATQDSDSGDSESEYTATENDDDLWEGFNSEHEDTLGGVPAHKQETTSAEELVRQQREDDFVKRKIDNKTLDALLAMLGDDGEDFDDNEMSSEDAGDENSDASADEGMEDNGVGTSTADDSSEHDSDSESNPDEASSNTSTASQTDGRIKPRASAFKSWATQQLNTSIGHVPTYDQSVQKTEEQEKIIYAKPAAGYRVGVPLLPKPESVQSAHAVQVVRSEGIQLARQALPVVSKEQEIMEAISNNPVVVIKGETGSGKTTQVPQFLFEAGYGDQNGPNPGMIGVTQPRRVAAVSMAKRVGEELGDHGQVVAHQIRFDTTISSQTAVKFMTDGILLRELSQDLLLKKYSAIVIDEAHERSVNTDLLIGMLSKIVPARMKKSEQNPDPRPLKLIIMSATLNINDFLHEKLFSASMKPPVVEAEGRQHKVTTHFALKSRGGYVEEVIEKIKRAHRKLPKGGMLVFLTGQNEIKHVLSRLRSELKNSARSAVHTPKMHVSAVDTPLEMDDLDVGYDRKVIAQNQEDDIEILVDEDEADKEFEIPDDGDDDDSNSGIDATFPLQSHHRSAMNRDPYDTVHLLPLYSQLPTTEQLKVFQPAPDRARMIVLATNVAETSITIPDIRYVFDCGRSKEKKYDTSTGVQSFEIDYISKASAAQRTGRAGRTGPGHCWRLYSSAVYERYFPEHTEPEILRTPAESVVLMLKGFRYPRPVVEFPFPNAPSSESLRHAEILLRNLGALDGTHGHVTEIGRQLSLFPLSPRLAKILVKALQSREVLAEMIVVVAALSVEDIFVPELQVLQGIDDEDERDDLKQKYGRAHATFSKHDKTSDVLKLLVAGQLYLNENDKEVACQKYFLRPKSMAEFAQLVSQLRSMVQAVKSTLVNKDLQYKNKLTSSHLKLVNNIAASGFVDQIALRYDLHPVPLILPRQPTRAIDVPYLPLQPLSSRSQDVVDRAVFIHPSSLLSRQPARALPSYIVYRHLQVSQSQVLTSTDNTGETSLVQTKTRMFPLTTLDEADVLMLIRDTGMIQYGKPVAKSKVEDIPSTRPRERICWVTTGVKAGTGTQGTAWPLPPSKVRQVMDVKSHGGWRVLEILA